MTRRCVQSVQGDLLDVAEAAADPLYYNHVLCAGSARGPV